MPQPGSIRAGRAFVELFADDSKLVRGLNRASARLKAFGAGVTNMGLKLAGLGAAAVVPLLGAAKAFSSMGDKVAKMAKRTGMSVEALSELQFVASQTGTEFELLENGIRKMQRSIYDAGRGMSTAVDVLADLGLTFKDLDGLAPEEQFKMLAERISRVKDPTTRAALAMNLFGRTGTSLLPMFARGAAGIEQLQKEARRLGLTMSSEDAVAAEEFTDTLDALWKVVKMGVFRVGAALAPVLKKLAKTLTDVSVNASAWIEKNREVIVTVLKVAAAVLAGGIALVVLGYTISGLGAVLGALATIISGVGAVMGVLGSILAWILSPIGLVIAAVAALGAYLIYATGAGAKALGWLGERFGELKDDALQAYQGIADALAAGDIGLAAKILWLTLKMEWTKGVNWLSDIWTGFWASVKTIAFKAMFWLTEQWIKFVYGLDQAAAKVEGFFKDLWTTAKMIGREIEIEMSTSLSPEEKAAKVQESRVKAGGQFEDTEQKKQAALDAARTGRDDELRGLDMVRRKELEGVKSDADAKKKANADELAAARKEWKDALEAAKQKRKAKEAGGPGAMEGPGDLMNKLYGGLDDMIDQAVKKTVGVTGTFNAAALLGLQTGGVEDRVANATERTAKGVEGLRKDVKNNQAEFA